MAKTAAIEQGGGGGSRTGADDKLQPLKSFPERSKEFLHDVRSEMRKVTTPTREQVQSTTGVVLVTVFAFAFYFWIVDLFFRFSIDKFIYHFSH
jgi:preprotein translocase subunit SecE